jgi:DNA-binding NarL/FixJ family response regulator
VSEAGDLEGLAAALEADRDCDLVLLDLNMPGVRGFSGLLLLRAQYADVPVMIISAVEDASVIRRAFELGASGYLQKSVGPTEIRASIETVLAGGIFVPDGIELTRDDEQSDLMQRLASLTPQQVRVLMMLSDGLMNKQIAYELSISEATVKAHVSAILQKLNVDSRTQAVIAAARIEEGQFEAVLSAGRESA